MNHALHLLLLLLLHRLILTSAAAEDDAPIMLPSAACSDELVSFSTCLPYVSVSPNNLTDSPPPQCCDEVSNAFRDGSSICLCYFVLRPKILGFPLDSAKILSLTSVCPLNDQISKANFSLETLCSGSAALPPLRSVTGPGNSTPHHGVHSPPPPPLMGSDQESSGGSSTEEPSDEVPSQPNLSDIPTAISSATKKNILHSTFLSFPLYILTSVRVARSASHQQSTLICILNGFTKKGFFASVSG